jgi:hypothetical protein
MGNWIRKLIDKAVEPKLSCFLCGKAVTKDKCTEVIYRYGEGNGSTGAVILCSKCGERVNAPKEDDDYVDAV